MDSLDAQCLLLQSTTSADHPPPDLWRHEKDGSLVCRYSCGTTDFEWTADMLTETAADGRRSKNKRLPRPLERLIDCHRRFVQIVEDVCTVRLPTGSYTTCAFPTSPRSGRTRSSSS